MNKPKNIVELIERRFVHMADGECWLLTNKPNGHGYVHVKDKRAHRVVWEAHNAEPIPEGMVIMHTCDNRACCNPEHLVLGTQSENIQDAHDKGRMFCVRKDLRQVSDD